MSNSKIKYVKDGKELHPWETAKLIFQLREAEVRKAVQAAKESVEKVISETPTKELTK